MTSAEQHCNNPSACHNTVSGSGINANPAPKTRDQAHCSSATPFSTRASTRPALFPAGCYRLVHPGDEWEMKGRRQEDLWSWCRWICVGGGRKESCVHLGWVRIWDLRCGLFLVCLITLFWWYSRENYRSSSRRIFMFHYEALG